MSKTYVANGTGSGQTLSELDSDKIPVYSTEADLDSDLANLADGQIVATKDEGASLSVPVDEVKSGDMHAVTSNAVAESLSYSTTEQKTGGVWIDGKPIYRKVIDFGVLPNTTSKTVLTGITNVQNYTNIYGVAWTNLGYVRSVPFVRTSGKVLDLTITPQNEVTIETNGDESQFINCSIILEYTKTTD